jgi:pteridine reductase
MPRMRLSGKTALVTGGARRVGRAVVEELARAGCRVIVHHHGSDADAAALVAAHPGARAFKADLRVRASARALVEFAAAESGTLDILVNSAADYARTPLATLDDDRWQAMHELNVAAPLRLIREATRVGVAAVVNVVDVAAWQPWPAWSAYATSKAALLHLTRCLALELAPGVRVNAVAPGTAAFPDDWDDPRRAARVARIPLGRAGSPDDIARAVRFLCEEDYVTGACLPVDGGSGLR